VTTPVVGDASIRVTANTDPATRALNQFSRDAQGRLRDVRGRFASDSNSIQQSLNGIAKSAIGTAGSLLPLATAAIPVAAALTPIAAAAGAAGVAVAAFGAALVPQVTALADAVKAQTTYTDAVDKYGARSKQAVAAQEAIRVGLAKLPPATQRTAAAVLVVRDTFTSWSNDLAKFTMEPVTRSVELATALLPKLTPLVKGASGQLNRLVTVVGGAIASPGFDALARRFADFANTSLRKVTDGVIHFARVLSAGQASGPLQAFIEFARREGPAVRETLTNIAAAAENLLKAATQAGPGMLALVNALAQLVASVPPGVLTLLLQVAFALKAISLAGRGIAAVSGFVTAMSTSLGALRAASVAAGGGVAGLKAAFQSLSIAGKGSVIVAGITILVVALVKLSEIGRKAPPNVERLTTSLGQLGRTGRTSGEAARVLGAHLDGLYSSIRSVSDPSTVDKFQQGVVKVLSLGFADSTPVKEAKQNLDGVDSALANLVKNGHSEQAAAAFEILKQKYAAGGHDVSQLTSHLDAYQSALADAKFEQQLAAQSMGLFGVQAQATQSKLDAQKASADGLRQSIQALNDVQRAAAGGMIGFEAAIDNATKAAKENGRTLDIGTEKGRNNKQALLDLAAATDSAAASARESDGNWTRAFKIYDRGRANLIATTMAMGKTRSEAERLADQILKIPDKNLRIKGNLEDLKAKLADAKARLAKVPDSRKAKILATIDQLEAAIRRAKAQLASFNGRHATASITIATYYKNGKVPGAGTVLPPGGAGGGMVGGAGTSTSDSNLIRASRGEFVVQAAAVRKYGVGLFEQLNAMRVAQTSSLGSAGTALVGAGGALVQGMVDGVRSMARTLAVSVGAAMDGAVTAAKTTLGISSPSRVFAAIGKDVGRGLLKGLTGTRAQIKATATNLADDITRAFKGRRTRVDDRLVNLVESSNKRLQTLAAQRDKLTARIQQAQQFAKDLTSQTLGAFSLQAVTADTVASPLRIEQGLANARKAIRRFTDNIKKLQKLGLRKDLIQQILGLGPEQGAQLAATLAGQSKTYINHINKLQSDVASSANALGRLGADALFDSGKKAGEGFLTGLKGQRKAIEDLMLSIAKSIQKAIKKALGIKSPSRVFAGLGADTAQGFIVGLTGRIPALEAATERLSAAVAGVGAATIRPVVSATVLPARTLTAGTVGVTRTVTPAAAAPMYVTVNVANHGVLGSQGEVEVFFTRTLERLRRQRRLPFVAV
jgi:hypothetical protein